MFDTDPCLYKRVDHNWLVRYDPRTDTFDTVPASSVRHVRPVAERRVRLSVADRTAEDRTDPHAEFRRAVALAMLDFQERAHAAGDPESAIPYLKALAQLAGDGAGVSALRMSWVRQPSAGAFGFKAVGVGEHAGRVRYGKDAERALASQDAANPPEAAGQTFPQHREAKGWVQQGTKAVGYGDYAGKSVYGQAGQQRLKNQQSRDERIQSGERARDLLYKLHANAGQGVSAEELNELATHLPNLTVDRLRRARMLLDASWGGQKLRKSGMIDRLQDHIRGMVDAQMAAAGVEPVNPEPPSEASAPAKPAQRPGVPPPPSADQLRRMRDAGVEELAGQRVGRATQPPSEASAPAKPAQRPGEDKPAPQSAPESSDYSKFDAIMRSAGDRAKAEQIARVTGVPVRPEQAAQAAGADETDLAPHGITEASSRDDVIAAAGRIAPELGDKVRRMPKAKQLAAIREHLKNAPKPAEPAPVTSQAATDYRYSEPQPAGNGSKEIVFFDPKTGEKLGGVHYWNDNGTITVGHVGVPEKHQRRGIASELYRRVLAAEPGAKFAASNIRSESGEAFRRAFDSRNPEAVARVETESGATNLPGGGLDRLQALQRMDTGGRIDPVAVGEFAAQYRNSSRLNDVASRLLSRMTPEQRRQAADAHRAAMGTAGEPNPVFADVLREHEPAKHRQMREQAIGALDKVAARTGMDSEAKERFAKEIRDAQGANENALADAVYGVIDRAKKYTPQPAPAQQPESAKADAVHPAVEKYAQAMLKNELDRFKDFTPEQQEQFRQRGALSDEAKQKFLEQKREEAREKMQKFADKELLHAEHERGMLHPQNKHTRGLFEAATGVSLPPTVGGTAAAVNKHLGEEFVAQKDAAARAEEGRAADAERQKKEDAAAQAEEEKYNGFGSDMAAVARTRARKFLDKEVRVDGKEADIRTHIGDMIADGWTVRPGSDGFRRLVKGDRTFSEKDFGKTAFEYAQHLLNQREAAQGANTPNDPVAESLFKPGGTLAGKPREPLPPHLRDGQPPEADELSPAPPGKLFDAGDEVPRAEGVRAVEGIGDAARRRIPDLEMDPARAGAPLEDHLDALTAIDRHMRKKGFPTTYFGDAADALEELKKGIAAGKYDRDELEEMQEDAKYGRFVEQTNPSHLAQEMRGQGLFDEARFFERHGIKVNDIAREMIAGALAGMPKEERDEPQKPAAKTVAELEDRFREEFAKPGADSQDAFNAAMYEVPPEVKRQFFDKHKINTGRGSSSDYYRTIRETSEKFGPAREQEPEPARQNLDNVNTNDKVTPSAAPPRPEGQPDELEAASGGTGEGRVPAGGTVGGAVRAGAPGGEAATGEAVGERPDVFRPGASGDGEEALRNAAGRGDGPADGARVGASRPVKPRLKRKAGGPPRDEQTGARLGGGVDGTEPALPNPTPTESVASEPPEAENPTDVSAGNFRYTDREFFKGGLKAKFNANMAAIRTLRQIEAEGRTTATPEEQAILSKFTGWGQFPALFNSYYDGKYREQLQKRGVSFADFEGERNTWNAERESLQGLLSPEEWEAAKASTLNAHYTHPDVVDAHWKIARQLGFAGGRYLETSAGVGYYLGLMPPELAGKTRSSAVELDPTTGGILKLLYPATNVNVQGFQDHLAPDHYYDLVASNVPFGAYKVHDPRYNKHNANIHDYFFLKSLDKVRPGGLVMHITSAGTLDKGDSAIRKALAEHADLVGAIRFPGDAHKENAGTSVVTDMVILRKRLPGEQPGDSSWTETTTVPDPAGGDPIPVNRYFAANPHMVLGTLDRTGSMYKGDSVNVSKTADYDRRLEAAIGALPTGVTSRAKAPRERFGPEALPAPGDVKLGGYAVKGGKVYAREGGGLVEKAFDAKAAEKIGGHLEVRDAFRAIIKAETAGADSTKERADLNRVYDAFVKKHGFLNAPANRRAFADDPDSPVLLALEKWDGKAKKAGKADIFTKPVVSPNKTVDRVGSVAEGLGVSLHETGGLDLDRVAKLTGKSAADVGRELHAQGLAYEDPSHGWQPADQYLSGNVRRKLALARAAAASDPKFAPNVAALEKVQPEDVHHDDIGVKLGAPWVPPSDVAQFAAELCKSESGVFNVTRLGNTGEWHVDYGNHWRAKSLAKSSVTESVWGAHGHNFKDLLQAALNGQTVNVYDRGPDNEKYLNREKTEAANAKVQDIKNEFRNWIWTDEERRTRLHRHYNDNFNNIRPIRYDGAHLQLPGKNSGIELRPHQKNFVWQVVTTGRGLAGHEVGTGKTYSMIAAAMELRRLGLARKPALVCKKANVEAITQDALKLYPGAKILSTADMFDAKSRKATISKIATGDYDMVILTHDHMDMLPMRPATQRKYLREEIAELEAAHAAAVADDPESRAGKELEKAKLNLMAKLEKAMNSEAKDDAVHFEDLGVDQLFIDEAHRYKTLPAYTKRRGMKGINAGRSQRATNMLMRARWLMEGNGGRGVVFLTGTPVTNTMGELYTMQKYLQPDELRDRGIDTFDAWASTFGDEETKMEKTATGEYKPVTRFSKFINLPELKQIAGQVLDVQRAEDLKNVEQFDTEEKARARAEEIYKKHPTGGNAPTGEDLAALGISVKPAEGGGFTVSSPVVQRPRRRDFVHVAPKSELISRLMQELQERAQELKLRRGPPTKGADNMLSISTDGRKGSVDVRMLYGDAPDDPESKTNSLVQNVLKLHKANPGKTQMIFSDIGVHGVKAKGTSGAPSAADEDADADASADSDSGVNKAADLSSRTNFRLYADIIDKLVEGGIPREKIADFSQLDDRKKEEAIAGLRTGQVLVGLGSTEKLGTGVNAQHKLLALHHLDCPWRPADLEQRDGRGWRNGNENREVQIHRYVTEGSLDELFWQGIGRKAKFIAQVLSPGAVAREMKEEDTEELSPEQIMAAASGDVRISEKVQLDEDVRLLQNAETRHRREQSDFDRQLRAADTNVAKLQKEIDGYKGAVAHLESHPDFELKLGGETYTDRKEGVAAKALEEAVARAGNYGSTVGYFRGLRLFKDGGRLYLLTPDNQRVLTNNSLGSVEVMARLMNNNVEAAQLALDQFQRGVQAVREKAGKPFGKAAELQKKIERQKELEKELKGETEAAQAEAEE